jgi:Na+-transporting methylmalonyl-CoA/oxaloacetate decarboxylase gamma subunit
MPFPLFALRVFGIGRRNAPIVLLVLIVLVALVWIIGMAWGRSNKSAGQ